MGMDSELPGIMGAIMGMGEAMVSLTPHTLPGKRTVDGKDGQVIGGDTLPGRNPWRPGPGMADRYRRHMALPMPWTYSSCTRQAKTPGGKFAGFDGE
jgi:hypothetical protein